MSYVSEELRMYSLVLVMAMAASQDTAGCCRSRCKPNCAPPPYCPPAACLPFLPGDGFGGPVGPGGPGGPGDGNTGQNVTPDLTPEEAQQLDAIVKVLKASKTDPKQIEQFKDYFRSASPEDRAKEVKEFLTPEAKGLSKDEEKQLGEIVEKLKKDKTSDKEIEQYRKWFRESASPEERSKDYKELIKGMKTLLEDGPARILVRLPGDAQLSFDGSATTSTGGKREFITPAFSDTAMNYYYAACTVERAGLTMTVHRLVRLRPGQTAEVNLFVPVAQQILASQR